MADVQDALGGPRTARKALEAPGGIPGEAGSAQTVTGAHSEPAWCAPARDRIDEANAARRELLQAVCDLAVKVDAIWPDRELDRERSFAYLVMQEFG